jgi:AcrR family transcriptional regulator
MVVTERKSKEERREEILNAAVFEFAERGLEGASTEDVARRAGISQPYVFRLFGTKKELFKAVVARCFRETLEMFQRAAEGRRGEEALHAMGTAYVEQLQSDQLHLRLQMQSYAACGDPDVREVVRAGFGDLVAYAERVSGVPTAEVTRFFATGMLMNVFASMGLPAEGEAWADRLIEACKDKRG